MIRSVQATDPNNSHVLFLIAFAGREYPPLCLCLYFLLLLDPFASILQFSIFFALIIQRSMKNYQIYFF